VWHEHYGCSVPGALSCDGAGQRTEGDLPDGGGSAPLFAWVGAGDGGLRAEFAAAAGGQSPGAKSA